MRAKSQWGLTFYYRSFMTVTYFARSCFHLPTKDLRSPHIPYLTPISSFSWSLQEISHMCSPKTSSQLSPGIHCLFLLSTLDPQGWVALGLLAALSVLLSSAAPARPTLSMEHLLIPTRQCCSHEIPSQLLWLPLPPSTTLVFSNLGSVRSKATEGPNILWRLTEVAMRNSFHFHTWFPLSEDSNMGN